MRARLAVALSVLLGFGVFVSSVGVATAGPGSPAAADTARNIGVSEYCASAEELAFLKLINDYRRARGLGTLKLTQTLGSAAEHHSKSMADHNYFSHTLIPQGIGWSQNMTNHGYDYNTYRGENIAAGNSSALSTFNQWKASPTHNSNMLSGNYKAIGIGRVYGSSSAYGYYWTTDFGGVADGGARTCATSDSASSGGTGGYRIYNTGRTSNSRSALNCLDGRQDTAWYTTVSYPPRYAYLWFDLGAIKSIGTVRWKFTRTGFADYFEIQVSNDRSSWKTIASRSNAPTGAWQSLNKHVNARYVRFLFRNPNRDSRLGYLAEVQILP
jgi:uncharacterized protein YkwD